MISDVPLAILLTFALLLPADAVEAGDPILGEWEQVASNAGACPTCRITVGASAQGLTVTANNGWSASLSDIRPADVSGSGRWAATVRGWPAGHAFTIHFHREGDRLQMTMTVETGAHGSPIVRATYRRPWQGV